MEAREIERKMDDLRVLAGERGLKLTHQRLEILRELASTREHPSVDTVFSRVRARIPSLSLDTVYRTVCTFERLGLVAKVCVVGDQGRYDADLSPHHHFICESCHAVLDFSWDEMERLGLPETAFELGRVRQRQVILRGTCARCLAEEARRETTAA